MTFLDALMGLFMGSAAAYQAVTTFGLGENGRVTEAEEWSSKGAYVQVTLM